MSAKSIIKEGFIFVLLTLIVVFLLMILLYDFVPTETKAEGIVYTADSVVKATLEEVSSYGGNSEDENATSLLKSYTVDAADLKIYETTQSYDSGKANPFVDLEKEVYENTVTTTGTTTTNTVSGTTSTSTSGSTSASGSTTGTFFEGSTK